MAIAVTCSGCSRTMNVKDDFAGRRALCPYCKAEVQVPERKPPREADQYDLTADDRDTRNDRDDRDEEPRRRPRLRDDDLEVRKKPSGGGGSSGGVLTGVLMMVGALVWFFGALALGRIFFYPPILFIVGLVTFIKGLSGSNE
jgi:DNA-directed RNA polymerase subunit RPC12/RpoP